MRLACLFSIYVCFFGGMQANSALLRGKFASQKLPLPYKYYLMQNNFLNGQGLGGSRCGSITVRFKHHTVVFFIAAPPLRYLAARDSKSAPQGARRLSANGLGVPF